MYCDDVQGAINDTKTSLASSSSSSVSQLSSGTAAGAKILVAGAQPQQITLSLPASIANSPALKGTRKQR